MRFVKLKNGLPVELSNSYPKGDDVVWAKRGKSGDGWISTRDLETFEEVTTLASYLTAMTGTLYLPADAGSHVSPRYDIIEAPKIGDEVSYAFNGDSYPDGTIVKISPNWMITTSTGKRYNRSRQGKGGGWRSVGGGTWSLVPGHIYEQNPSF